MKARNLGGRRACYPSTVTIKMYDIFIIILITFINATLKRCVVSVCT